MEMTIPSEGQFTVNAVKNNISIDEMLQNIDKIIGDRDIPSSIDDINHAIVEGYANAGMRSE